MDAVLLGLDEAVCTRQSLLWTLTSTALRRLRVHARNLPAPLHLLHTHRCVSRPLYQVGCIPHINKTNKQGMQVHIHAFKLAPLCKAFTASTCAKRYLMQGLYSQPPIVCQQAVPPVEMETRLVSRLGTDVESEYRMYCRPGMSFRR